MDQFAVNLGHFSGLLEKAINLSHTQGISSPSKTSQSHNKSEDGKPAPLDKQEEETKLKEEIVEIERRIKLVRNNISRLEKEKKETDKELRQSRVQLGLNRELSEKLKKKYVDQFTLHTGVTTEEQVPLSTECDSFERESFLSSIYGSQFSFDLNPRDSFNLNPREGILISRSLKEEEGLEHEVPHFIPLQNSSNPLESNFDFCLYVSDPFGPDFQPKPSTQEGTAIRIPSLSPWKKWDEPQARVTYMAKGKKRKSTALEVKERKSPVKKRKTKGSQEAIEAKNKRKEGRLVRSGNDVI